MLDKIGSPSLFSQEEESDVPIAQDEWDPAPLQPSSDQQKSVHCVVPIQAPAARSGGGWDCVPRRTLEDWCPRLNHLAAGSLAPATRQKYEGALRDYWAWFLGQRPLGSRYDEEGALVAFLLWAKGEGKARSWAVARLAAVAFVSKVEGRPDCSRSFLVRKMLAGWGRMAPALPDQRKPITVEMLFRLCDALPLACHSQGEAALFKCSFLFAFFGALRVSEFTTLSKLSPSGAVIQFPSCRISEGEVSFSIPRSKTDQMGRGSRVTLKASPSSPLCPVRALRVFLMFRPPSALPLFVHQDGSPITRYQFSFMLRRALAIAGVAPDGFSSHSFRIGAATAAHAAGLGVPAVQAIGRWKSSAYKSYVRAQALGWGQ